MAESLCAFRDTLERSRPQIPPERIEQTEYLASERRQYAMRYLDRLDLSQWSAYISDIGRKGVIRADN
jgi:hypothetical protein